MPKDVTFFSNTSQTDSLSSLLVVSSLKPSIKLKRISIYLSDKTSKVALHLDALLSYFKEVLSDRECFEKIDIEQMKQHLSKAMQRTYVIDKDLAKLIRYAFNQYPSKAYDDELYRVIKSYDENIYRPNHGLVHTLRKLNYINAVLDYLSTYAIDDN